MKISKPDRSGRGCFRGALITLGLVIAIILVAIVFAARTEGMKAIVTDRLSKTLGEDLSIGSIHIGWPYVLVIEDIKSQGLEKGEAGFKAAEVRMGILCPFSRRLDVHRGVIRLVQMADGGWQPSVFGKLGQLPESHVSEVTRLTRKLRKRTRLRITEGRVSWIDQAGVVGAMAEDVALSIVPVKLPNSGRSYYYSLHVYNLLQGNDAGRLHDVQHDWLSTEENPYIVTSSSVEAVADGDNSFWRMLPQHETAKIAEEEEDGDDQQEM